MNVLAISGSLRAESSNTALLRAAIALAPAGMTITLYDGLDSLPHYSPERDTDPPPAPVAALRAALAAADAVIVCTPEYAHGMPGSLKNLFDWCVSSADFDGGKPAAAISAGPSHRGGDRANAALAQTLAVLGAHIPDGATLVVPMVRAKLGADGGVSDAETAGALREVLATLGQAVTARG